MAGLRKTSRPPQPLPLRFHLDGNLLELADRPVRWWVRVLAAEPPGCWWFAVPMALSEGRDLVMGRLLDLEDPFDLDDAERLAEEALDAVLGMGLWPGHRLARMVAGNWVDFDGWCVTQGFDPLSAPVGRVLAAIYAWRMAHCEKKADASRLESQVWGPPPIRTASGHLRDQAPRDWSDERESAAFMAALG